MAVWQSADRITAILFWLLRQLPSGWLGLDARWLGISIVPWLALIVWRFHAADGARILLDLPRAAEQAVLAKRLS